MAGRNTRAKSKKSAPAKPRRRLKLAAWLAILGMLGVGVGAMRLNANLVRVRYANVTLQDLPESFDGTKILFASDFDLCGSHTAAHADRLFAQLQLLRPDILLLGGDYASPSLFDRLNGKSGQDETATRQAFFAAIADFQAPLGKFAVSGDNDGDPAALGLIMSAAGVKPLDGGMQTIANQTDSIVLAGIGEDTRDVSAISSQLSKDQCVIALMHRPGRIVDLNTSEARDHGHWADLVLAGHTHGGQILVGNRSLLSLDDAEKSRMSGWTLESAPMLVTQGVGCEGVNLRLGSQAEVWLITLKRD